MKFFKTVLLFASGFVFVFLGIQAVFADFILFAAIGALGAGYCFAAGLDVLFLGQTEVEFIPEDEDDEEE